MLPFLTNQITLMTPPHSRCIKKKHTFTSSVYFFYPNDQLTVALLGMVSSLLLQEFAVVHCSQAPFVSFDFVVCCFSFPSFFFLLQYARKVPWLCIVRVLRDFFYSFLTFCSSPGFLFWRFCAIFLPPRDLWKRSSSARHVFQFPVFCVVPLTCSHL